MFGVPAYNEFDAIFRIVPLRSAARIMSVDLSRRLGELLGNRRRGHHRRERWSGLPLLTSPPAPLRKGLQETAGLTFFYCG